MEAVRHTGGMAVSSVDQSRRLPCSLGAGAEQLAGTAAYDVTHLLVEHPGNWGRKAWEQSSLPEHVRSTVGARAAEHGIRISLVRRHGRQPASAGFRVFGAHAMPGAEWLGQTRLDDPDQLLDLDLAAWAAGRMVGLEPVEGPLLLVCTNGRRDACCAEFGRPIAKTLAAAHPEETWEVSHLGGHRFAGAMLTLPAGLSYGRLDPETALEVADRTLAGELVARHLRGRVGWPQSVQAAEIHLREQLGIDAVDALDLDAVAETRTGNVISFRHGQESHTVTVERIAGPQVRASCGDEAAKQTHCWRPVD